jgi:hypothetical protein
MLPGPGKYYGFSASNSGDKNVSELKSLDQQWNNNSVSTKFATFSPNNNPSKDPSFANLSKNKAIGFIPAYNN